VFDTAHPRGDLARWFPRRARIIDLSQTQGQVALFDTMIAEPRQNYVVDLQAEHMDRFFRIFGDIAFDEAAREAGAEVMVHFVLDRSMSSIQSARHTRSRLKASRFVIVLNEAIGNLLNLASAREHYNRISKDGEIVLPRLSAAAREHIEQPGFSFATFIAGRSEQSPAQVRYELWRLLEILYDQRSTA